MDNLESKLIELKAIHKLGAFVKEIICVGEKIGFCGRKNIHKLFNIPIKTLIKFELNGKFTCVIKK